MSGGAGVEVLEVGRGPERPRRPAWVHRLGWLLAGLLVAGGVVLTEQRDGVEQRSDGGQREDRRAPERLPVAPPSAPRAPAPAVTALPPEEVPAYWSVQGSGPGTTTAPDLRTFGRLATVRVQCIGPGTLVVRASTGRAVQVLCPARAYESVRYDVSGTFLRAGATLEDAIGFEVDASQMSADATWRVWTFLTYTLI